VEKQEQSTEMSDICGRNVFEPSQFVGPRHQQVASVSAQDGLYALNDLQHGLVMRRHTLARRRRTPATNTTGATQQIIAAPLRLHCSYCRRSTATVSAKGHDQSI